MFDMKKICLFLILIFILTTVSSFAENADIPKYGGLPALTYSNAYVFTNAAEYEYYLYNLDGELMAVELQNGEIRLYTQPNHLVDVWWWEDNDNGREWKYLYTTATTSPYYTHVHFDFAENPVYLSKDVFYYNYENVDGVDYFTKTDELYFRNTLIDFWADVNIVTPPSGVHDTLSEMTFNISTEFNKLLTSDEIKSIDYEFFINNEKVNFTIQRSILKKLKEAYLPVSEKDCTIHILSFEIIVPVGENFCEIIYYNGEGIEIGYGSVEFKRLAGFIDADGDGKDDRTGRASGIRHSSGYMETTIDKPEKPEDDANVIDWFKYLCEYIGYIFEVLINSISNFAKNVVSGIGSILGLAEPMFGFIGQFFSSMPVEIRTGFIAMFSVSAFLVIMKMIRG